MRTVVLFAAGSPLVVDAEETCARAGIRIAAAVTNVEGPAYVSAAIPLVSIAEVDEALRAFPVVVALFTPGHRKSAYAHALRAGFPGSATIVHPVSPVAGSAELGHGVFVNAGCVISGACRIGAMVIVNRGDSVGHHARIGDYVSIGPGAVLCGSVVVERGAVIGAGAVIAPEISIGANAVIGAGSVVSKSVPAEHVAVGNPCRILKTDRPGYNGLTV